jgi:hypothetical protein
MPSWCGPRTGSRHPAGRYPEVRKYYSEFLNAANEQVVLKKG